MPACRTGLTTAVLSVAVWSAKTLLAVNPALPTMMAGVLHLQPSSTRRGCAAGGQAGAKMPSKVVVSVRQACALSSTCTTEESRRCKCRCW